MDRYYYNKYNIATRTEYSNPHEQAWGYIIRKNIESITMWSSYSWSSTRGFYGTGDVLYYVWGYNTRKLNWYIIYPTVIAQWQGESHSEDAFYDKRQVCDSTNINVRGTFIETIVAQEGIYPDNGQHNDNYWYIKGERAFPNLYVNINGAWKKSKDGTVIINGTIRNVVDAWCNINGVWRKS